MFCEAGGLERAANDADAAVHHVGRRQHVGAGFRLHERLLDERGVRLVVDDLVADEEAVMAVAGVGVERDVEDDTEVELGGLDGACCAADEVVGVEGLASVLAAFLRIGERKECDGGNAEPCRRPSRPLR